MRSVARFLALDAWERRVLVRAWCLLPVTATRVRWLGLARANAAREVPAGPRLHGDQALAAAWRIARWVDVASRHQPLRPACLPRSLVLQRLLREEGIASDLRLGVRKDAGRLEAHAWVECEGIALADPAEGRPFAAFDAPIRPALRAPR